MGAQSRLFASLASGSGKATAVVVCAVMLLAGCGGSGGSASDASTPVIRGDVAEAGVSGTTVIAPGVPAAPTGAAGDGKVTVTVAQGSSGGTPATYTVTAVGTSKTCTVTGATGSCDVTGLTNGTPYTFTATATNEGGASGMSTPSNSVTPVAAATTATVRTVTFDSGYAGLSTTYTQTGSSRAALLPNTFRWGSMSFLGWNTERYGHQNGKGEWFANGAGYPFASDIVLYAQWGKPGEPYDIIATVNGPGKVGVWFKVAPNPDGTPYTSSAEYVVMASRFGVNVLNKSVWGQGAYGFDDLPGGPLDFTIGFGRSYYSARPAVVDVPSPDGVATKYPPGQPPAPTVAVGDGKFTVTVTAGSGSTPTYYMVYAPQANGAMPGCKVTGASGSCDFSNRMIDIYKPGNQVITPVFFDGRMYSFKVVAHNEVGGSAISLGTTVTFRDSSTVSAPGTPPAPTVVAGTAKVTATVAAGTSGGAPASYTVTAYAASGTAAGTCIVTGASGSCDVTDLTGGGVYTVKATAKNTAGTSGESVASSPVTVAATVPGTPPAPTVVAGTAKVTATVAAGTAGGVPASYTVTAYAASGTAAGTCIVTGASGSCDVTALTGGSTYTVKATAKNTAGTSGESVASSPVTLAATVPGTPPAPTVVAGTAKVTATVAAGTSGGTPASYTVTAYTVNGTAAGTCTVTGASGSCDVTALTAGSTYTVKASARNTGGTSGESVASSPVTVAATVPGAPGLTALSRRSKTEVWVTFSAPSSDGGQPVTEYTVTVKGPNGRTFTQSFPAQARKVPVGSLNNGGFYTFTVRSVNSVGTSNPSNAMRYLNLG